MGCVNKASKEFKNLAAKHNLDSNALELIIHKYWLQTGNETLFPTDVYIQAQLGNSLYQESGKHVRQLWAMQYSSPREYASMRELGTAKREASRFFPKSAIVSYKNAKGTFVLSVKRPVERADYSKDDFFDDFDNMKSMRNVKVLDLGIKSSQPYGIGKVQELYNRFNQDRTSQALADRVFSIASELGLRVSFNESLSFGTMGRYTNNNTILYKKSFLERDIMNDKKASILLHEVLHAISMYALSDQTKNWKRSEGLEKFRTEMNSLYQDLKTNPVLKGERGIVDVKEFVAELGNPVFRAKIQQIDKENKNKQSFWSRILDAFKSLLGLHTTNTYYQRSMNALDKALAAFDLDTYMRYNGVKSQLRQGYNAKEWEFNSLSDEQLKSEVNKYANTINNNNQRSDDKNNRQYETAIKSAGNIFKDAYSITKRGSSQNNESLQGEADAGKSLRERLHEESSKQQKELISWAKDNKNLIVEPNDYFEEEYGESQSGSETTVWLANDNGVNVAIKNISLNHYATPQKLLDRILIHNMAFPTTAMQVLKVGTSDNGMSIVVKQPWIESGKDIATPQEIEDYMITQGFTHTKGQGVNAEYSKDNYIVTDIRPENVIKQPDGTLAVIDCFAVFKSADTARTSQYTLNDFIKSLSGKDLKDELGLIKQESADYDLVNNIEEEKRHSGKAVPQDFTFNDGTTIKAPFHPNVQQIDALNAMSDFMKSNETTMTLSGYAGTGKTSLMEMIAKKGRKQGKPVVFCASTNKAATVLNDRVSKAGFKAETLNKVFGISVEIDPNSKTYNARNLVNHIKDTDFLPGSTVIIDEASMIGEENYKILNDIAEQNRLKIIYVGDSAQLAPVGEDKVSKVFRNGDGKVVTLTQVERTDDNAVLREATDLRNGKSLSGETSFNSKGEGVAYISPQHQEAVDEVIEHYVRGLKKDPNYFRILAFTNKAVSDYNNKVRTLLGYDTPVPRVGEPMTGYANWGYEWRSKSYRFINSEAYKVIGVEKPVKVQTVLDNGTVITMEAVPVTLVDSLGNRDTFNFMDIKNNPQNRQAATMLANEKKRLWEKVRRVGGKQAKAAVLQKINSIDSFLFVNDNIEDGNHNLLQSKTIDFGYAMTVHKSQGSTFTNVLMDDVDISRAAFGGNKEMDAMEMIDLGEETANVGSKENMVDLSEEIDLGDFDEVETAPAQPDQASNLRQQLEYVGVSRATDTVTVISNNIKKEGSPLHPDATQSSKTEEHKTPVNSKGSTINSTPQRSDNEVTKQVVDHLKNIPGIKVFGRSAMEEFLKTHNLQYLQQAIAFGNSNPYENSKYSNKIPEILAIIKANKYNNPGTDIVTLDSDNNKVLYLIDHSSDKELADNLKDGDGFGIRKVYNIDKLSENDIREITRNIASDYQNSEKFIRSWLQRLGITSENLPGIDIDAAIKRGIGDNGQVDVEARGFRKQAYKNRGGLNGREDKGVLPLYTTEQGEVYGFVDKDGNIYLDETKISPEHPIHEYTHLWDRAVQKHNPQLWNRGVELMKQSSLWNDVLNDEHYGKQWQSMNLPKEKLENLIASEVHARLVGENGEKLLNSLAKNKGEEGIISKLKQWILDMWKEVKATFGSWSQEDLDALTLKDFNHMTVRDFVDSTNLKDATDVSYTEQQPNKLNTVTWGRTADNSYEVSSKGDKRFSALYAKFKEGTTIWWNDPSDGVNKQIDLGGKTIEEVYQKIIKKSGKGKKPDMQSIVSLLMYETGLGIAIDGSTVRQYAENHLPKELLSKLTPYKRASSLILGQLPKETMGDYSYYMGYKPLWEIWAEQNPELMNELQTKSAGKTLTDQFANTKVSQARALSDILNSKEENLLQSNDVPASYEGFIAPSKDTIFVFGSNPEGRHGAGAAKTARDKFGAIYGQGEGLQGNAYALPTKDLRVKENRALRSISAEQITENIRKMYDVARQNPSKKFKIAYTNGLNEKSLNGYTGAEMIKMFKDAGPIPSNVIFSKNWTDHWNEVKTDTNDFSDVFQTPISSEVEIEDVMKPWRDNSGKSNKARRIYLKGQRDKGYFEVVKDMEDNNYSVHFKPTDSKNPNAFTQEEKEILFKAVADVIPEGVNLSTWGELSKGGVHGLNRFSNLGFTKTGERKARMKTGEDISIPVFTKTVGTEPAVENPSLPEGTTQKVSLPGYEHFNDLYDETPVDAEWKIPYLKELDAQLSNEKSEEDNQNIINQMNKVLQSTSKEEYLQELSDSKIKKTDKILNEYDKLIQQINNLLEGDKELDGVGSGLSATEIRHSAELIANSISDMITQLQTEEGAAERMFPTVKTNLDFQTASRKRIVDTVDINNLIKRAYEMIDPETSGQITGYEYDDLEASVQADFLLDNWDAMIYLAADIFAFNEGFGITKDYSTGRFVTVGGSKIDYDNFNDYSNDEDIVAEEGGKDEQEHWQIESRTIDVLNSMSALVRQGLHECYLLDEDGNKVTSKWGVPERVNPRKTVNSILRWTQGSLSLDDMIKRLSDKQRQNPWLSQLITRLSDKSGKETDFQSQFYGVFSKHFQLYSIVLLEDGKYHSMPVNSHPALSEAMKAITAQFKVGEHPLFGTKGRIKATLLDNTKDKNAFSLHKAHGELLEIVDNIQHGETLDGSMAKSATENVMGVCRILGYNVTEDMVADIINAENVQSMTKYLGFMLRDLDKALKAQNEGKLKDYNPFKFGGEYGIDGSVRNFLTPITDVLEDTAVNAFYDSGKMYQSYVTPSFMTKLFNKFKQNGQEFEDFIMEEYGSSEWFKDPKFIYDSRRGWRNVWLQKLAGHDENVQKVFDHKVELNFNKHNYMRNMSDAEYALSLITEYFAENPNLEDDMAPSWFRVPMQSNKPSSEFIKFYSYRGDRYKDSIVNGLHMMFLQELSRIQTVRMRNLSEGDAGFIKNFDTNGRRFCFLPVLNAYLENTAEAKAKRDVLHNEDGTISKDNDTFAELLQKKIKGETALTSDEETILGKLVDRILRQSTEDRVQSILDNWENSGILEAAKSIKGIYPSEYDTSSLIKNKEEIIKDHVRKQAENFLWNDSFAAKNILQLTLTDIAFYKDTEDLQKRLAQLHAPGNRGRVDAIDYEGNRVSDGKYRTFILQDFATFKSNIIANISEVFDRKIANAPEEQKAQMRALKESLVGKKGKYTKINVTDAQGYSSPSSYRKKAFIFGRWSRHAEGIYQKLLKGEYTYTDLETAFQPLKPFVYSKLTKNLGVDNAPIQTMQVPFQAKNAEYLLIMADAMLQGEKLSRPNLLRAVYRVMEDSEKLNPTKGIDTVQFESAIKSGLQGAMDIHQFIDRMNGEDEAYSYMMNRVFKEEVDSNTGERVYRNYDTDTFVHETSYEDYCLQQEVPEHFKEHSQAHGSQIRMITPSDLDLYTTDENGNQVDNYYEWTEPDGTHRKVKANEFRKEYEETIAANIEESIDNLAAELHLDSKDSREKNIALSRILQREILSSPRYGIDLIQACSIDKETGEFRIPKGDPIQAKRIEQLINSIIKNRINKQKIAGGPIVQVSNFGTSRQLHIRFNDKKGNLMPLEEEYNPSEHNGMSYAEYCHGNQGGIAYFEVFIPIWANEIFEKFSNPDGTINVKAIEATDPELLKMVSYRIPTEDKYSCAPMKAVGFMPREAGDAIMLPYELTEIDDSDFDVDKRYVMRKEIPIKTKRRHEIEEELFKRASESYAKAHEGKTNNKWIGEQIRMFMDNPQKMRNTDKLMQWLYSQYQQVAYYTDAPKSGRLYRDNKIIDMTYAVLTNEMTADKILNPGGFDAPKRMGYMGAAYKNVASDGLEWSDLEGMTTDELKKLSYTDKDLTFADTQVQFYKQNAAAASLIGVFAVNKVAHATLEGNDIYLDVSELCGEKGFEVAGTVFSGRMLVDKKYDAVGNLIGKTLGSLVSASADAVKDPVLNLMNINMTTAGMLNTMLRLGMTFDDAALFLSQDVIERILNQFNRENLSNYVSLDSIIDKWLEAYRKKNGINETSSLNAESLTKEEMVEGLTARGHEQIDYKVLLAFQKMRILTDAMRKPTYVTRFNSISSAVGPLIVDNLIMEHKMEAFKSENSEDSTGFYTADGIPVDMDDILFDHPVLKQFAKTVKIARDMFLDMPTGSAGFRELLEKLPADVADKMYSDKKLLDQFSNFYQSYMLVQSGMVNPKQLKEYVMDFPKWFIKENFKEKYQDNALIQAIRMNVSKKSGMPYLMINITGMDEQAKEELRSAWVDLHKADPELSQMLFNYSFFRAGVGFSPKTFMALVPTFVKERLMSKDGSTSYVETYRRFPKVVPDLVIDQFIRNNWNNSKLVPQKGGKGTHYDVDMKKGVLKVYRQEDIADLAGASYIKTKMRNQTYLWHMKEGTSEQPVFELIKPLGNNGEYLEMSTSEIVSPLSETSQTKEDNDTTDMRDVSPAETVTEVPSESQVVSSMEHAKTTSEVVDLIMKQNPKLDVGGAEKLYENIKGHEKMYGRFLQNVFKHKGLDLNVDEAINEFKKYC